MTPVEITLAGLLILCVVLAAMSTAAAYRNGVTDGYGYAKEPTCPGYRHAGEYLTAHMVHRWPELAVSRGERVPPKGGSGTAPLKQK